MPLLSQPTAPTAKFLKPITLGARFLSALTMEKYICRHICHCVSNVSVGRSVSNVCSKSSVRSASNLHMLRCYLHLKWYCPYQYNAILESGRQNISEIVILSKYTGTNLISRMILHSVHENNKKTFLQYLYFTSTSSARP